MATCIPINSRKNIPPGDADELVNICDFGAQNHRRYLVFFAEEATPIRFLDAQGVDRLSEEIEARAEDVKNHSVSWEIEGPDKANMIDFADLPLPCRLEVLRALEIHDHGNSNCLSGMWCPTCGSKGPFSIVGEDCCLVSDEGTEDNFDFDWRNDNPMTCKNCNYEGRVAHFKPDYKEKKIPSILAIAAKIAEISRRNPDAKVTLTNRRLGLYPNAISLESIFDEATKDL